MEFQTKEQIIANYISSIDFGKDNWGYRKIQTDLRKLIGEAPALNFNYKKEAVLNEFNSEATEINVIESVDVFYSPNLDKEAKKLTFEIGKINS